MQDMAVITASAYLNSCGRQGSATADELIAFAGNTLWHQPVLDYAVGYTKKVMDDFRTYKTDYLKELKIDS